MTDFSTKKQIKDKLKGYKPKSMGPIGEAIVALQFLNVFKEKIENIINSGNNVDLTIKFKDDAKQITVEVKSSAFKNDYYRNHWSYGVPIKVKDFDYEFDLLGMVNFIPPDKTNSLGQKSKVRSDYKNVTLYFMYSELESLLPNPFMYIPTTTLLKLKTECSDIYNFLTFFNNYYKDVTVDPTIVFDEVGFSWDNYKLNNKLKGELGFPSWFDKTLSCKYLASYAVNKREFYKREVISKWKERIDLRQMVDKAINNKSKKSRIYEEYPIDSSFCKNCPQKCKYILVDREF
ncbi:MAG: hypothetical protein KJI71_00145 [Patescibacteria group bacterium]|nr:hypothetical protein [Patescibacteria group bacterium]